MYEVSFGKEGVGGEEEAALWCLRAIYFPRLTGRCFLQTNLMSCAFLASDQSQTQLPQSGFPFKSPFGSAFRSLGTLLTAVNDHVLFF